MTLVGGEPSPELPLDPAYPTTTPPDPVYPCQTLDPIGPPLDGVAVPAIWSRLEQPLGRALEALRERSGLLRRAWPERVVALHYGRIAINAHAWERLRAGTTGEAVDPALAQPPAEGLLRLADRFERLRLRVRGRKLRHRLREAESASELLLRRIGGRDPAEIDTAELARGPLHERDWTEILLPWLGLALRGETGGTPGVLMRAGVSLEERYALEVGRRLTANGLLEDPGAVAYLTVVERLRAVHEASPFWARLAGERMRRVEDFVRLEIPARFWGRPRVDGTKTS